ncbi:TPA: hypothetical protein OUF01_000752 [Klebsiella michiganensis]|nr:hypothetical protein [Klebsiella michiganensis]HCU0557036.1 hypothetical protein [Klebsiella michiganensis]HCU0675007.1 hypothetical protein [Klebsiella michiganensis]
MNIETVNELIQSLESAGELSIKETKVMVLAKAFKQLAAENVALKAAAILLADEATQIYRRWNLIQQPDGDIVDMQTIHELLCACHETPATDRIAAGIKADGVEDMANHFFKLAKDEANSLIAEQWRESGRVANEQAKQLREGAK